MASIRKLKKKLKANIPDEKFVLIRQMSKLNWRLSEDLDNLTFTLKQKVLYLMGSKDILFIFDKKVFKTDLYKSFDISNNTIGSDGQFIQMISTLLREKDMVVWEIWPTAYLTYLLKKRFKLERSIS